MKITFDLQVEVDCSVCQHHTEYVELEALHGRLVKRHYCKVQEMHLEMQPPKCSSFNLKYKQLCKLYST